MVFREKQTQHVSVEVSGGDGVWGVGCGVGCGMGVG